MIRNPPGFPAERSKDVLVFLLEPLGPLPRLGDQTAVPPEPREFQVGEAGLARPEQLALAAKLEIDLGEREAVRRVDEGLKAPLGFFGQILLRARDEQAVRLLATASDPPPQLVE